jgi:hypothetical protein
MRIKFIKVEEGLETRGNKPSGKVLRTNTGRVVIPSGGEAGKDDNPNKPTKKLKKMVGRFYRARTRAEGEAENSSTEILGNKIEEGKVKAANKAAKREFQVNLGRKTGGFQGTSGYAANLAKRHGANQGEAEEAAAVARGRAASDSQEYATPRGSNRNARRIAHQERSRRNDASTEILGNKIVEGIMDWILGGKKGYSRVSSPTDFADKIEKKFIRQSQPALDRAEKQGNERKFDDIMRHRKYVHGDTFDLRNKRINRRSDLGNKQGTGFGRAVSKSLFPVKKALGLAGKSRRGLGTRSGVYMTDIPPEYTQESLELFENKIVESFDNLLNELSDALVKRAEKKAKKKVKQHSKISSDAGKVGARGTAGDHGTIADAYRSKARRFRQRLAGDRERPTNPESYKARRSASREYYKAKQKVGIGTRTIPVARKR